MLLTPQPLFDDVKAAAVIIQFGNLSATAETESGTRHLGRGKPVALLAYLAASPGRRASRERLATLLWSEGSTEQARQNLRQTLWYIRRRLGQWLQTTDDFVELIPGVESDRDLFLAAAREHRLRDAIAAYTGPFIPDFAAPGAAKFRKWAGVDRRVSIPLTDLRQWRDSVIALQSDTRVSESAGWNHRSIGWNSDAERTDVRDCLRR